MAYEFKLPDLGEGLTEGEVSRWLVEVGQEIAEDDPLVEIATDKTTVEIPSPAAGTVTQILVQEGEVVPVGTLLVVIGGDAVSLPSNSLLQGKEGAATPAEHGPTAPGSRPVRGGQVRATPLVRRLAQELGVDLETVTGTGPQGRITEGDVRGGAPAVGTPSERREPIRGIRRQMFEHLTRAHEIPTVTWVEEADFGDVDLKLLLPRVLKAVAAALREFPELNARVDGQDLVLLDRYDIGIAVQIAQGLVVPVVRACDSRSLDELDAEVRRLAEAAQVGKLLPEELRGGTFTVTSAGRSAGLFVTPLLNHPEVAILGGNVSVTFDHRVIDGKRAADFGLAVIAQLQTAAARATPIL
jgi:pyruvate dehydrogenase E2 component (dihydrolipoamide acetyltransferase)